MDRIKNVIILNDFDFINGGTSQIAILTANALAGLGYKVVFFSAVSNPAHNDLSENIERINTAQFDILNHPSKTAAMIQGIWNKKAARLLKDTLSAYDPGETIIHLHGWTKALSASIGNVFISSKIPVVCTLHDYFIACPNGGFYNYPKNEICTLKAMSIQCICSNCDARSYTQKIWRLVRQRVQMDIGRMPSGIGNYITVSTFSKNILQPYLPPAARIFNIPSPIKTPANKPARTNTRAQRALCIGRLSAEKGIALACEAAVRHSIPLTVVGDGPLAAQLKQQYPQVDFKGWLSPDQVFQELQNATVLVFPSLLYETQGLAVLEALSAGLPVIVSDKCAASEFIDGKNGVTFQIGNVDDLALQLKSIFQDPVKAEAMSQYAYAQYWEHPFTTHKYLKELVAAYNDILENYGARTHA